MLKCILVFKVQSILLSFRFCSMSFRLFAFFCSSLLFCFFGVKVKVFRYKADVALGVPGG